MKITINKLRKLSIKEISERQYTITDKGEMVAVMIPMRAYVETIARLNCLTMKAQELLTKDDELRLLLIAIGGNESMWVPKKPQ